MKKSWDLNNSTAQQTLKPGFVEKSPPPSISKHNLPVVENPENKANQGSITVGTKNSNQVIKLKTSWKRAVSIPVLKIEFGLLHPDFRSVWSPQKARKFDICNRWHKWVHCVYWQCHFDTLSFTEQIQFCTPLGAYWIVLYPRHSGSHSSQS